MAGRKCLARKCVARKEWNLRSPDPKPGSPDTSSGQDAVATDTTRRLAATEVEGRLKLYANLVAASNQAELRQIDAGHVTLPFRHAEAIVQAIHDCRD
jgi:hypothetical protein